MPNRKLNNRLIALFAVLYVGPLGFMMTGVDFKWVMLLFGVSWALTPIVAVPQLLGAVRAFAAGEFDPGMLRTVMYCKLAALPYFFVQAVLVMGLTGAMMNPWLFWLLPFTALLAVPILFVSYVAMLSTSVYVIAQILLLWRKKELSAKDCFAHIGLQLIFGLDLFGALYLCRHYTQRRNLK